MFVSARVVYVHYTYYSIWIAYQNEVGMLLLLYCWLTQLSRMFCCGRLYYVTLVSVEHALADWKAWERFSLCTWKRARKWTRKQIKQFSFISDLSLSCWAWHFFTVKNETSFFKLSEGWDMWQLEMNTSASLLSFSVPTIFFSPFHDESWWHSSFIQSELSSDIPSK